jgi:hypothetical protein
MNQYLERFRDYVEVVRKAADDEPNLHRKAMLRNMQRHMGYEFSGQDDKILSPAMTVPHPVYRIKWGDYVTYDGAEAVQGYYNGVNEVICTAEDHKLAVHDWGIASYSTFVRFVPGKELQQEGVDIPKPDETIYVQRLLMAMFWHYTPEEDSRLIGEDVFMLTPPEHEELAPEDAFTPAELAEVARTFL